MNDGGKNIIIVKGHRSRYRVIRKLGKGGQAFVYKATDLSEKRKHVALKVVNFKGCTEEEIYDSGTYKRFHWEYMLTSKLRHPQVATASDYGVDTDRQIAFMARNYLNGRTLTELLNQKHQFTTEEANHIILSVAGILEYIHSQGVVHCDIKPSNVFMEYGDPILIDFGLAAGASAFGTYERGISGTMAYMAPEVIDPTLHKEYMYAPSRDWWGLGCVAYNIFTGKRMYRGNSESTRLRVEIMKAREQKLIQKALSGHETFPVVKALLERDPTKRPSSRAELEAIINETRESD